MQDNENIEEVSSTSDSADVATEEATKEVKSSDAEIKDESVSKETAEIIEEQGFSSEAEKKIHEKILEDMGLCASSSNSNSVKNPERASVDVKAELEREVSAELQNIRKMQQLGFINSMQEQNLKKAVTKKAFDKLVTIERERLNSVQSRKNEKDLLLNKFSESNPDFFTSSGRKELLNYLKSDEISLKADELTKITGILKLVEKSAIENYLKKSAHEKTLSVSNENAKKKLSANAQSSTGGLNLSRSYTREQIGNMTCAEFAKNEKSIMEQLRKGLIK